MIELNGTILIQLVNFFIMIFFLNHFLFKPILKVVEKRNNTMRSLNSDDAKFRKNADRAMREYDSKMLELKKETANILLSARRRADKEQDEMINGAREKFKQEMETAKEEIKRHSDRALEELRGDVKGISRDIAEKILGRGV